MCAHLFLLVFDLIVLFNVIAEYNIRLWNKFFVLITNKIVYHIENYKNYWCDKIRSSLSGILKEFEFWFSAASGAKSTKMLKND